LKTQGKKVIKILDMDTINFRKALVFGLLSFILIISSCKKEDDNNNSNSNKRLIRIEEIINGNTTDKDIINFTYNDNNKIATISDYLVDIGGRCYDYFFYDSNKLTSIKEEGMDDYYTGIDFNYDNLGRISSAVSYNMEDTTDNDYLSYIYSNQQIIEIILKDSKGSKKRKWTFQYQGENVIRHESYEKGSDSQWLLERSEGFIYDNKINPLWKYLSTEVLYYSLSVELPILNYAFISKNNVISDVSGEFTINITYEGDYPISETYIDDEDVIEYLFYYDE